MPPKILQRVQHPGGVRRGFAQRVYSYFQVTADMTAEETFAREIVPSRNIRDNYEKIILTLDKVTLGNYGGIRVIHLPDWLLTQ